MKGLIPFKRASEDTLVRRKGPGCVSGNEIVQALIKYQLLPGGSAVKNLPAMQETWTRSLGREDPREEGTATHSSILAWRIPWTEEPGGLQSMRSQSRTRQAI